MEAEISFKVEAELGIKSQGYNFPFLMELSKGALPGQNITEIVTQSHQPGLCLSDLPCHLMKSLNINHILGGLFILLNWFIIVYLQIFLRNILKAFILIFL